MIGPSFEHRSSQQLPITGANGSTSDLSSSIKSLWEQRRQRGQNPVSAERETEGHVEDVFLVLALMGEVLLPLGVYDADQYGSTLAKVESSLASCDLAAISTMFEKLPPDMKHLCTAALSLCAVFAPLHVYRGFGASVLGNWDWGCPDSSFLEKKAKKATSVFSKAPDSQPNKHVLLGFDRAIQVLQSRLKTTSFLRQRPSISGFADLHPRYDAWSKKETKHDLSLCNRWASEIDKRGHPSPPGTKLVAWGIPWATWTSSFSCVLTRSWEMVMSHQTDPGRLLHAFICRGNLHLHDGQVLTLPPGSPAESLACWLAGLPGMSHRIVTWDSLDTAKFESKIGKKLTKRLGRYPLPNQFVIRNSEDLEVQAQSVPTPPSTSPIEVRRGDPPPYSLDVKIPSPPEESQDISDPESQVLSDADSVSMDSDEESLQDQKPAPNHEAASSSTTYTSQSLLNDRTRSATMVVRRKPAPPDPTRQASAPVLSHRTSITREPQSAPHDADDLHDLSRPLSTTLLHRDQQTSQAGRNHAIENDNESSLFDRSSRHLRLLRAVAKGEITPQQLQGLLADEADDRGHWTSEDSLITSEPQELDDNSAASEAKEHDARTERREQAPSRAAPEIPPISQAVKRT